MMSWPVPEAIQPLLGEYIEQLSQQLPRWVFGFYIVGSIALGEFNERFSDIDFVTIPAHRMTGSELQKLHSIHQEVEKKFPLWKLSGSYIQACDLGKIDHFLEPHPHYHDGILHPNGQNELNLVTWWELKNFGIAVVGPEPQEFPFSVDWDLLIENMRENLNSYWVNWTRQPTRIVTLSSDWGIQWVVTGVLRQFYTFRENTITTKVKAARYALGRLPARWHPLIKEAINIREGTKRSLYRNRIVRAVDAFRFLKYIIQTCNRL